MNETIRIEPADADDLEGLLELMAVLAADHTGLDSYFVPADRWQDMIETMLIERLGTRDHCVAVAREGGVLVGMVSASIRHSPAFRDSPRGVIENLVVEPSRRRHGIGTRLVNHALAWCAGEGVRATELSVAVTNEAARLFYERLGFRPVLVRLYRSVEGNQDG
ncbi:MAG: GNAT family N-acetyltransferase [Armatimonadetes bacterium]|nr:GNAT family N-acetyltransferase [Armatimonadota bacterium]